MEESEYNKGDWIEGDNGYGVVVEVIPRYYQYGEEGIPEGKKVGDKKGDSILMKRFCSFDFKVRLQTRLLSPVLVSKITKKDMSSVSQLLNDKKTHKRFEEYQVNNIDEVANFSQLLKASKISDIREKLHSLENNGSLKVTYMDVESYLKEEFNIELFESPKRPNCYIQLVSDGLGNYRGNDVLFKRINIQEK